MFYIVGHLDISKFFVLILVHHVYCDESAILKRPVWNIAHMVNSIIEVDYRLSKGANALEADVNFDADGMPTTTFHGPPCDCWRHCNQQGNFSDYLVYIRRLLDPANDKVYGKNLVLLFLDLKLDRLSYSGKVNAGTQLAKSISTNLYNNVNSTIIYLVISINHVNDMDLVLNFIHYMNQNNLDHLMKYIGWDVGMNDDIKLIDSTWKKTGNNLNLWQGDGLTNCISPFYNLNRLTTALAIRDSGGYMSRVYQWTIDMHDRMRDALRLNVDAIMTNHPERLLTVLEEVEFKNTFRLATKQDNPFELASLSYSRRLGDAARYGSSSSPTTLGGFMAGLSDIVSSWMIYVRDIPYLGMPAATRWIPKRRRQRAYDFEDDSDLISQLVN